MNVIWWPSIIRFSHAYSGVYNTTVVCVVCEGAGVSSGGIPNKLR